MGDNSNGHVIKVKEAAQAAQANGNKCAKDVGEEKDNDVEKPKKSVSFKVKLISLILPDCAEWL